ncbi:MAG TPA: uroporphyrinogen-III synthase [Burkholderiales bacterium]
MSAAAGEAHPGAAPLAGRGVLVTRPAQQAGALARLVAESGGYSILFPVIEIMEVEDLRPLLQIIDRLQDFDLAIFISPNAVDKAMNLVAARRAWPPDLKFAAVGQGSARELRRRGLSGVIAPEGRFDSEALLALPEFGDMAGRRVVIFRGEGGREFLGDTLRALGAEVTYAECYRRRRAGTDAAALLRVWARGEVHAVTVTSAEGLHNLFDMLGKLGQQWLKKTPLFAPHPRIAQAARELGIATVVTTGPGDEGLFAGLRDYFAGRP